MLCLLTIFSSCRADKKEITQDERILCDLLQRCGQYQWEPSNYIDSLTHYFLGKPYVAATLESADGEEDLVINLRELDCMTFVENVVALHRLLQEIDTQESKGKSYKTEQAWERFPQLLENIRYRNGIRGDYTSRLHYTSEWIQDNVRKAYVKDITSRYSDSLYTVHLNFMSSHPEAYKAFGFHPEFVPKIAEIEASMTGKQMSFIPKDDLPLYEKDIPSGLVVAIIGSTPGLDFAHLGFTCRQEGRLYMLHASSSGKQVMITREPLHDYLQDIKRFKGIVLLELLSDH